MENRCNHGLDPNYCALCQNSGYSTTEQDQEIFKRGRKMKAAKELKKLKLEYFELVDNNGLENWNKPYTDEDIKTILTTQYSLINMYKLAIQLLRSVKGVRWVYVFAFAPSIIPREYNNEYKQVRRVKENIGMGKIFYEEWRGRKFKDTSRKI